MEPTADDERLVSTWLERLTEDLDHQAETAALECEAHERGETSPTSVRREPGAQLASARAEAAEAASRGVQRDVWLRFSRVFRGSGHLSERASALHAACASASPPASAEVRRELDELRRELDESIARSRREAHLAARDAPR